MRFWLKISEFGTDGRLSQGDVSPGMATGVCGPLTPRFFVKRDYSFFIMAAVEIFCRGWKLKAARIARGWKKGG